MLFRSTIINGILFILSTFQINILYINTTLENSILSSTDIVRGASGYPILNPLVFAVSYLRLRKHLTIKQLCFFLISSLVLFFTYTRGEILAFAFIVISIEVFIRKAIKFSSYLAIVIIFSSLFILIIYFLPSQIYYFNERIGEVVNANRSEERRVG